MTSIRRNKTIVVAGLRLRTGMSPCAPHTDELSRGSAFDGGQEQGHRVSVSGSAKR